ncbi:ABC transporter substrate-binding protein [Agrobacterium rosae]|uniref:ABC transporter substrate-binding protein n=2 Tax=Pseudomonadota TaxID=1224 RepID=A0AAE5VQJ0_9HYPH|nr:ABC transporter substrate-binding protein [Agrobacterium rosae]KAA3509651.1 ABC transporter substrate-binding protein [Agrobacterium rosae]KAA3516552.1 ABC transporter substrate-binding protein [Agrobacterium rosae]MCM2435070.1 ABC transporter substrate-binding protein [Agrobacterium rosae]MDX8330708.1 ABC transporter substrate-binding protein [Agrobacterium rosae]MQB50355.1 ABC transporter substrate-binding protein [Agrobacterium rosae]
MSYQRMLHSLVVSTGLLGVVVFGWSGAAFAQNFQQAPNLDEKVKAGKLPSVNERLPEHPFVETMVDGVGKYGGTLRTTILANGDQYNLTRTIANELLVRWDPKWSKVEPSLAEKFTASEDATTYTFTLRKGLKWSDGQPFTVDDILFWYEDVFMNPALSPAKNPTFTVAGKPVKVRKVDEQTVEFKFDAPYGLFLQQLAYGQGHLPVIYPKHYLSQFHEKYNKDGIPALLKANPAAGDWVALFNSKVSLTFQPPFWQNLALPTLNPWILTVPYADGERVAATRNPFYWKVDTSGNQLPYIDNITWAKLDDPQLMALKMTSGEFDFAFRHINNATFKSVLFDGQESGKYRFVDVKDLPANDAVILLNLNSTDPVKKKVFQNKDFRVALSRAINRQEIIDLVYVGQGAPAQVAVQPEHELFNEKEATQYTEYDPAAANAELDKLMPKKDGEGFRLDETGKRFTINFMVADVFGLSYPDVMQMVQQYAKDVGIDIQIRTTDRARLNTMWSANEQDAYIWNCVGGLSEVYTDPRCYMPFQKADIFFAVRWAEWYANHEAGEEPPENVKALMAAYDKVNAAVTDDDRKAKMEEFLNLSADNFLNIGISRPMPKYMMVSKNLKNVVDGIPITGNLWHPAPTLSQWYFDKAK